MSDSGSNHKDLSQPHSPPKDPDNEPINGRKIFFAPSGNEQTFIDHNCTLDDEGYPLYPNRQTIFVKTPEMTIHNFGHVGFPKTTSVDWLPVGGVSANCQGDPKCPGSAGKFPGKVGHQACKNTLIQFDENKLTGWAILRHHGTHNHPWPAPKKPDPLSKLKLKNEIKKNPSAGAFKLKLGKPTAPLNPFESVTKIHEAFVNRINPDKGGAGVGDMFHWNHVGLLIISVSFRPGVEHFTFQTKWMAERLITCNHNNKVYSGGLLSDVTYRLFEMGYLLSTSMFCEETGRWIPVQLSWIRGLSAEYYQAHFTTLFDQFLQPSFSFLDRETLVRQVVDFSLAQREGFILAYMKVFSVADCQQALSKLKGCHEHFRAQVTRVKRNWAVVPPEQEAEFQKLCLDLLVLPEAGKPTHDQKIDELRRLFPKTRRWLDWWTMLDVEAILFPSKQMMISDSGNGKDNLPDTTNAQESMHCLYYMISEGKKCLIIGMAQLYAFVKTLEDDWHAVMRGVSIEYGAKNKGQQDLALSIGWQKSPKRNPANRKKAELNDGRAPDTTAALLPKNSGGRPPGSRNLIKDSMTTYISYAASDAPARKFRCWLAAALESLYALFNPLWLRGTNGLKSNIFTTLVKHFNARSTWELTLTGQIRSMLTAGQNSLHSTANKLSPGSFNASVFCSTNLFIDLLIDPFLRKNPKTSYPPRDLFTVTEVRTATCEARPDIEQPHPRGIRDVTVLRIQKEMFEAANMEPCSVQGLITTWASDGIASTSGLCCKSCPSTKQPAEPHHIIEKSVLTVENGGAPQHLYLFAQVSTIFNEDEQKMSDEQQTFMAGLDFPRYLEFHGVKYTLFARGFWNGSHYWCKMLKNLGGISGVWMHDDRQNGGIARLISPDQSTIAGRAPNTSWVFYSRPWSSSEDEFVSKSIANIARDHPGAPGSLPFAHLGMLLNNSPNSPIEDQQIAALSDKQGPKSILLDGKEVAAAPKKNRRPKKVNLPLNEDDLPIEDQHTAAVSDKQAPKILLDAKEVATAQKKKWRPKKVTRLQEAGSSPSGAAQATIGAPSGEEKPGDLKRKASGEFRIRLKVLKTNNPQPMIADSNIEEKKCPIKGRQASTTIKPTIEEQKTSGKVKIPSDRQQKPIRVGSRSSTRKASQALQA
ncbi:hypothetical protein PTTG_28733 [Puccinia triticina 1-1 BBBD Race 1]|uniref:GCM domain-containing protein n=1 Tax=Puccinia triticina (isolate 1-1 / race 1 (BBBD)) TaxID=630390 RepID=A0A180G9Z6_PUCT1|nr:hypothetical protein PTTG_28733 [Puccinia triticina 1-1 BBBD Race 1]